MKILFSDHVQDSSAAAIPTGRFFRDQSGDTYLKTWYGALHLHRNLYHFSDTKALGDVEMLPEDFSVTLGGK